jgi:hypothetical protein
MCVALICWRRAILSRYKVRSRDQGLAPFRQKRTVTACQVGRAVRREVVSAPLTRPRHGLEDIWSIRARWTRFVTPCWLRVGWLPGIPSGFFSALESTGGSNRPEIFYLPRRLVQLMFPDLCPDDRGKYCSPKRCEPRIVFPGHCSRPERE